VKDPTEDINAKNNAKMYIQWVSLTIQVYLHSVVAFQICEILGKFELIVIAVQSYQWSSILCQSKEHMQLPISH